MPELPDVTVYQEHLERECASQAIERIRILSPFVLRSFDPPIAEASGKRVREVRRIGKRLVLGLDEDLFLVFHLMIAGRLRWKPAGAKIHGKMGLLAVDFEHGSLMMTEASKKKRASLHLVRGDEALLPFHRGGVEPLEVDAAAFSAALTSENRTLKRALTDPRIFSGIGNAYSDEILHRAQLSPVQRTRNLKDDAVARLHDATRSVLIEWTERLRAKTGDKFPDKVTAFHKEMAVHGKHKEPCPECDAPVQRIVYAENEANYCAKCQTGGKLLADRALSPLFRGEWPRTLEELEELRDR